MRPELLKLCHTLLITVVRTFYDVQQQLIIDYLILNNSATENELSTLFGINSRQLNAICFHLKSDRIIRQTLKKQVAGNEFDVDFMALIYTVKYKILKTRIAIENQIKSAKELQGYVCPTCQKKYSALDVDQVLNFNTGLLECEYCDVELEQDVKNEVSDENLTLFTKQTTSIVNLLREIDLFDLPEAWYSTSILDNDQDQNDVVVELTNGEDNKRDKGDLNKIDHSVPMWHQKSTVKRASEGSTSISKVKIVTDSDEDEFEEI